MIEKERMAEYVMDLIKIDSLSRKEREVALKLRKDMEEIGAECSFDEADKSVGGNIGNLLVKIKGNRPGSRPFFLSAHMDTVGPGEGIKPRLEDGVIKSDGTTILGSDDKSGLAIIVEVIRTLKEKNLPHGDIEVAFTICEEIGLLGAKYINASGLKSKHGMVLDSSSPYHLVVRCPSAHKLEFKVYGLEAHAGVCPEKGISAIEIASEAISGMKLGRIDSETTANIGIIRGGLATNIIPGYVQVVGEARSHDEEKLDGQVTHMRRCFQNAISKYNKSAEGRNAFPRVEEEIERTYHRMDVSLDSPICKLVHRAADDLAYSLEPIASGGGCDANYFNRKGIDCVNLGTGMKDIHTVNEFLVLEEFNQAAHIVLETIKLNASL